MKAIVLLSLSFLFINCQPKKWQFKKELFLKDIQPIGITFIENQLWIADGESNRVVKIDSNGKIIDSITHLNRPMHINTDKTTIYIPQFGNDSILKFNVKTKHSSFLSTPSLDAPAGVSVNGNEIAIADFYHHNIHFYNGKKWSTFGKKGSKDLEFKYPTDIQIINNYIYVADAYNHRIQILSKEGTHIKTIGESFNMNASTGLFIHKKDIYITDFENNRILITNEKGESVQVLNTSIEKPTDIIIFNNHLWVLNFKKGSISVFSK